MNDICVVVTVATFTVIIVSMTTGDVVVVVDAFASSKISSSIFWAAAVAAGLDRDHWV